jgi:hypothetical protein
MFVYPDAVAGRMEGCHITAGQYPRRAELSSLLALLDEVQNDAMRSAQVCKHVAERCSEHSLGGCSTRVVQTLRSSLTARPFIIPERALFVVSVRCVISSP